LTDWLAKELRWRWILLCMLTFPFVYMIWSFGITEVYSLVGVYDQMVASSPNAGLQVTWIMWGIMVPLVLGEELFFRFPLSFAARFLRRWERLRNWVLAVMVIGLSVTFGWLHGGWLFAPIQGVMGLAMCLFYLKCGGFNGKFWKPLFICWITHVIINSELFSLQLLADWATSLM